MQQITIKSLHRNVSSRLWKGTDGGRFHTAFTLVELLVVLVILATLILLSVGGYKRLSENKKQIRCIANLRKIYIGLSSYILDKGYYPGYRVDTRPTHWPHALVPYIDGDPVPANDSAPRPWMQCPARRAGTLGYGYNSYFGNVPPNASDYNPAYQPYWHMPPHRVVEPSTKIVIGDNKDDTVTNSWSIYQVSRTNSVTNVNFPRRHFGAGNYLFADGHVELLSPKDLVERNSQTQGKMWIPF